MTAILDGLRRKVSEHLEQHLYDSAVFWADKLVTMSGNDADDVYRLAQAYYLSGLHQRAMYTIQRAGLTQRHDKFRYIVAKCQVVREEWKPALESLGDRPMAGDGPADGEADFRPAMCLLRGKIYDAMEHRSRSLQSYRRALQLDCCCFEAFEHLTQHHLLSSIEQESLMREISFGPGDEWVALLYRTKIDRYHAQGKSSMSVDVAESAPANSAVPAAASPVVHLDALEDRCALAGNLDLQATRAETQYYAHDFRGAASICRSILKLDPHQLTCLPVYLCTLHELKEKTELFYQAHTLIEDHPQAAVSWFAVGCYYHLTGNFDSSRRYFEKATHLDNWFAPAWLGFGNAFAAQDESDQAMVAYRTAARLFPGCHLCPLFIGMECARTNQLDLATQYFEQAREICPHDPLVYNELGALSYKNGDYEDARAHFVMVLSLCADEFDAWEATLFNLGHACRKLQLYDEAIGHYYKALNISPRNPSIYTALGFAHHLRSRPEDLHKAIDYYHQALGIKSEDTFATAMLRTAFEEVAQVPV